MDFNFYDTGAPPIGQAELIARSNAHRVQGIPLLRRMLRTTRGGGFGDVLKRPWAWTVWVTVDGLWRQLESARGHPREWTSLDRAERWLREQGFTLFAVQNVSEDQE
jgi:hypothetical protein